MIWCLSNLPTIFYQRVFEIRNRCFNADEFRLLDGTVQEVYVVKIDMRKGNIPKNCVLILNVLYRFINRNPIKIYIVHILPMQIIFVFSKIFNDRSWKCRYPHVQESQQ